MGLNQIIISYFSKHRIKLAEVAKATELQYSTIGSMARRPDYSPNNITLSKLMKAYPGLAEELKNEGNESFDSLRVGIIRDKSNGAEWEGVPMYDIPMSAGNLTMFRDEPATIPSFHLNIPFFKDASFGFKVSGDSMSPEIKNGDYVIVKEAETIIYGDIYLIITFDGIETVKQLFPNDDNPDNINLVPYNKEVPITPIPRKAIAKLFKVKAVFKTY